MLQSKTLILDIETSPIIAYTWGRRDVNIALNQIKEEWYVIAWAAKWLNDPASKVMYRDQRKSRGIYADKELLRPLWKLLDEADILITQNGQSFDSPKLNARFIMNGMKPPSPYKHLDTYRIARRIAAFTSNKLEYLTDKLCTKYKKLTHDKFPGQTLWTECLKGNQQAWNEMKRYNIHDVLATEELYNKLKAWAPSTMPQPYASLNPIKCGVCGEYTVIKRGTYRTKKGRYQQLHCKRGCGAWTIGDKLK